MEPSEEQYLIINALDTLGLLGSSFYDPQEGAWYIETLSPILPIAKIMPDGEIIPIIPELEI